MRHFEVCRRLLATRITRIIGNFAIQFANFLYYHDVAREAAISYSIPGNEHSCRAAVTR